MMSKEAKIGLLFSLVFIVALAVILRSVHQGGSGAISDNHIMNVDASPIENTDLSATVQEITSDRQPPRMPQQPPASRQETMLVNQNPAANTYPDTTSSAMPASGTVRHVRSLPGSNYSSQGGTIVTQPPTGQIQRAINSMENALNSNRTNNLVRNGITTQLPTKTQPHDNVKKVVHTVVKGDNLTKIAMKYYGKKEGNKLDNLKKIFEANKDILHSMSDLKVGQRLTIPPLPGANLAQSPSGTAAASGQSANRTQLPNTTAPAASNSRGFKVYVVKENDSLWKIAAKELGNGAKFTEIAEMNARTLSDENSLRPGMKLKLPK